MKRINDFLAHSEDVIYVITAVILIGAAFALVIFATVDFLSSLGADMPTEIATLLDNLLLVLMIVEILHTVGIFLKKRKLVTEPFLAVGIIAAIRRVLIITTEQVHPTPEHAAAFRMTMMELGLLTVLILAFVFSIYLLRRQGREEDFISE